MASTKGNRRREATSTSTSAVPARTTSYTRFKAPLHRSDSSDGQSALSTLPPAPFESEVEVSGLEWWLSAHMALASELLWLEQLLDTEPESGAHFETVRVLVERTEAVRDALYELYCDAADARVAMLVASGAGFETRVRRSYAWCTRVVGLLAAIT